MPSAKPATSGPGVEISSDRMKAVLRIPADTPSDSIDAEGLTTILRDSNVNIDDAVSAAVQEAVDKFLACPHAMELTVAEGKPAVPGEDGRLQWQPGVDPEAKEKAKASDKKIDFYEQSSFISVAENQHLATLIQPTNGEPGFDVAGQQINPTAGKAFQLKLDPTVRQDSEGQIFANRAGLLNYANGAIRINPVLEIRDSVNFSTGNINFMGSVLVGGGVCDRFKVECTEDAFIKGLAEAGHVKCGRNLNLEGGMAGRDQGTVDVGSDLTGRHLVGVSGTVAGHVKIQREIINCILQVNGNVEVPEGAVIGGDLTVGGAVHVMALGSDGAVATILRQGFDPKFAPQIKQLADELLHIEEQLRKPGPDVTAEMLATMKTRRSPLIKKLAELRQTTANGPVNINVVKALYPGVTLIVPRHRYYFHKILRGPFSIRRASDGLLNAFDAAGKEMPLGQVARCVETKL